MQTQRKCYMGIDVSKSWFDLSLMIVRDHQKGAIITGRFDNTAEGLALMGLLLESHQVPMNEDSLLVVENTGVYHRLIWEYCSVKGLPVHIGNAARIKWSLGITRARAMRATVSGFAAIAISTQMISKPRRCLILSLSALKI